MYILESNAAKFILVAFRICLSELVKAKQLVSDLLEPIEQRGILRQSALYVYI